MKHVIIPAIIASVIVSSVVLFIFIYMPKLVSRFRDYNCSDFKTQSEAQEYLLPGDPYHLDGNHDKIACNSLAKWNNN